MSVIVEAGENEKVPVVEEVELLGHWISRGNSNSSSMMEERKTTIQAPVTGI